MSDTDSFINEVTEEVRRDRLYAMFRRWAWLAVLIVAGLVGGAAWLEYSRAQERATAEAFGDGLLSVLDRAEPEARVAGLDEIAAGDTDPRARMIAALLAAGEVARGGAEAEAAAAALRAAAEAPDLPRRYRDLAMLKAEMMAPSEPDAARLILGALAEPGAPFAALAEEQLALLDIRTGDLEAGIDRLRSLERSAAATPGLQQRASQLIVALEAGSVLVDTAPEPPAEVEVEAAVESVGAPAPAAADAVEQDAADEGATAPDAEGAEAGATPETPAAQD
ncbi:hypothetical protein [Roseicyclus sp.]